MSSRMTRSVRREAELEAKRFAERRADAQVEIQHAREVCGGKFTSISELCSLVDLNVVRREEIENLILQGEFDDASKSPMEQLYARQAMYQGLLRTINEAKEDKGARA